MDLHVPEGPIRSIKDFLIHIGIVTIGILIALCLEQAIEAYHRAHLAHQAVDGFTRELTSDRTVLKEVLSADDTAQAKIIEWIDDLSSATPHRIGKGEDTDLPGVHFDIMSTASWDTAMATQALTEIPYERVHRYAGAYDAVRVFIDVERRGLADWQDLHAFGNDPTVMSPEQRRALIERMRRYETDIKVIKSAGDDVLKATEAALGEQPHA